MATQGIFVTSSMTSEVTNQLKQVIQIYGEEKNVSTFTMKDLSPIIDKFEEITDIKLLNPEQRSLMKDFCEDNLQLSVTPDTLINSIALLLEGNQDCSDQNSSPLMSPPNSQKSISSIARTSPEFQPTPLTVRQRTMMLKSVSSKAAATSALRRRSLSQGSHDHSFDDSFRSDSDHSTSNSNGDISITHYSFDSDELSSTDPPHFFTRIPRFQRFGSPQDPSNPYTATPAKLENDENNRFGFASLPRSSAKSRLSLPFDAGGSPLNQIDNQIDYLEREKAELKKKLVSLEKTNNNSIRRHEEQLSELHRRIDDLKAELCTRKREISDLKGSEKAHLQQINALETEISNLTKALDLQKSTYSDLKKQFEEKCAEFEKILQYLSTKEEELLTSKSHFEALMNDQQKIVEEKAKVEAELRKLELEVTNVNQLEEEMEELKEENFRLQEQLDKVKYELEEIGRDEMKVKLQDISHLDLTNRQNLKHELEGMNPMDFSFSGSIVSNSLETDRSKRRFLCNQEVQTEPVEFQNDAKISLLLKEKQTLKDELNKLKSKDVSLLFFPPSKIPRPSSTIKKHQQIQCDIPSDQPLPVIQDLPPKPETMDSSTQSSIQLVNSSTQCDFLQSYSGLSPIETLEAAVQCDSEENSSIPPSPSSTTSSFSSQIRSRLRQKRLKSPNRSIIAINPPEEEFRVAKFSKAYVTATSSGVKIVHYTWTVVILYSVMVFVLGIITTVLINQQFTKYHAPVELRRIQNDSASHKQACSSPFDLVDSPSPQNWYPEEHICLNSPCTPHKKPNGFSYFSLYWLGWLLQSERPAIKPS